MAGEPSKKQEQVVVEQLTIELRRDQMTRLKVIRQAMEERAGRSYPMNEMFVAIIDGFLDGLDDGK